MPNMIYNPLFDTPAWPVEPTRPTEPGVYYFLPWFYDTFLTHKWSFRGFTEDPVTDWPADANPKFRSFIGKAVEIVPGGEISQWIGLYPAQHNLYFGIRRNPTDPINLTVTICYWDEVNGWREVEHVKTSADRQDFAGVIVDPYGRIATAVENDTYLGSLSVKNNGAGSVHVGWFLLDHPTYDIYECFGAFLGRSFTRTLSARPAKAMDGRPSWMEAKAPDFGVPDVSLQELARAMDKAARSLKRPAQETSKPKIPEVV